MRAMAPVSMANSLLLPVWQRLLQRHPAVRLELVLSNGTEDVWAMGATWRYGSGRSRTRS
ncbi:Uncharacterised protein [Chromobacterium violaceum]|uniref:Uncharacterized protein n=1 Tax=Chromobacterium violaceum TaxID=536 RepID=A0A447T6B0_CHRVL|nr:Uncharacterised protein [Chromobacterium violaceum]